MKYGWLILLLFPSSCFASITITEIAWMGSAESANHEWIELHNTGADTNVDGWRLHDANNLTIDLVGVIPAGQHVVLERTSDASVAGTAFLIYTGALPNTGGTLVLRDAAGAVIDQVNGGTDWTSVGGDNTTKDTAQLVNGVWKTAPPTPGSAGSPASSATATTTTTGTTSGGSGSSGATQSTVRRVTSVPTVLTLPDISLQLDIVAPAIVHVGQPVTLDVAPSGVGDTIADSLQYNWSLGNGQSMNGKEITYRWQHPGEYVVVVAGEFKRQKQLTRATMTVLPVELAVSKSAVNQTYFVHNNSDHEIDIGGYRLVGETEHLIPKHTFVLPNTKIAISLPVATDPNDIIALMDQSDKSVAMHIPGFTNVSITDTPVTLAGTAPARTPTNTTVAATPNTEFGFASDVADPQLSSIIKEATIEPVIPQVAATVVAPGAVDQLAWQWYALIALLFAGVLSIYLVPQKKDSAPWV